MGSRHRGRAPLAATRRWGPRNRRRLAARRRTSVPAGKPVLGNRKPGPRKRGSISRWLLIAVALLVTIGVSVAATLYVTGRRDGRGTTTSASSTPNDIASANDTGPVSIITDEPTCDEWVGINNDLARVEANGWSAERSSYGAASDWTPKQREEADAVVEALHRASRQMMSLAKMTPHRVVREMYEQFVVFGRAYRSSLPHYSQRDNYLADTYVNLGSALLGMCNSITLGSTNRLVAPALRQPPTSLATPMNSEEARRFIAGKNLVCSDWVQRERQFIADNLAWATLDANIPASQWTAYERSVQLAALPLFDALAKSMEEKGSRSGDPAFADLAMLGSVYLQTYVSVGEGYIGSDSWLSYTGLRINNAYCSCVSGHWDLIR